MASLPNRSAHLYSSLAMSPSRKYAIAAGKDTLQLMAVSSKGLSQIRTLRISQHFQTAVTADNSQMHKIYEDKQRGPSLRDTFGLAAKPAPTPHPSNMSSVNVVITDVAWSKLQKYNRDDVNAGDKEDQSLHHRDSSAGASSSAKKKEEQAMDSIVAAAGSNGVVVVWSARRAFLEGDESSSMANQQPEAILSQHSRAVNRLAFHPRRPGLLLTASQVS